MQNPIDKFLNSITMYRLLAYGLGILFLYSIVLAFIGILPYGGMAYIYSAVLLLLTCWSSNRVFAKILGVPANFESWIITAFILYFLLFPVYSSEAAFSVVIGGLFAIASKYLINFRGRHLFNPAAVSAFLIGVCGLGVAVWWVGSMYMFPAVLILGILVVRKIRKFEMFGIFLAVSALTMLLMDTSTIAQAFLSWPLVFFGSTMLTEPLTMPGRRREQFIYAGVIALIASIPFNFFGLIHNTPEFALILGNLGAFSFGLKRRLSLVIDGRRELSKDVYEFSFVSEGGGVPAYLPGQYLEWTIPPGKDDSRGNRRYFTLASSPTENALRIGVKFIEGGSTFKEKLLTFERGQKIVAGALSGDFVLPKDKTKKIAFIAGGIGVTPFRSIVKYLSDTNQRRDIALYYTVKAEDEIAYRDIFSQAESAVGLRPIYITTDTMGFINEEMIKRETPDYIERLWYLSGPGAMVTSYKKLLKKMGVKWINIKTDYFPGF